MMNRKIIKLFIYIVLEGCAGKFVPPEVYTAETYCKTKNAVVAKKYFPSKWESGEIALIESRNLARKGKTDDSRLKAIEATIHFKMALSLVQHKLAEERILKAKRNRLEFEQKWQKFAMLRQKAEENYLEVMNFHLKQQDEAEVALRNFEIEKEKYEKLSSKEKEKWNNVQTPLLMRDLKYAISLTEVAKSVLECRGGKLEAESIEVRETLKSAENSIGGSWENSKPLVIAGLMKAMRMLVHSRIMVAGQKAENPAEKIEMVEMIKSALPAREFFVSAGVKGIMVSVENPWDSKNNKLTQECIDGINKIVELTGNSANTILFFQSYYFKEKEEESDYISRAIAMAASRYLNDVGYKGCYKGFLSLGNGPVIDPGFCLNKECPGGRLDIIIVSI